MSRIRLILNCLGLTAAFLAASASRPEGIILSVSTRQRTLRLRHLKSGKRTPSIVPHAFFLLLPPASLASHPPPNTAGLWESHRHALNGSSSVSLRWMVAAPQQSRRCRDARRCCVFHCHYRFTSRGRGLPPRNGASAALSPAVCSRNARALTGAHTSLPTRAHGRSLGSRC